MAEAASRPAGAQETPRTSIGGVLEHVASNITPHKLALCALISLARLDSLSDEAKDALQFLLMRETREVSDKGARRTLSEIKEALRKELEVAGAERDADGIVLLLDQRLRAIDTPDGLFDFFDRIKESCEDLTTDSVLGLFVFQISIEFNVIMFEAVSRLFVQLQHFLHDPKDDVLSVHPSTLIKPTPLLSSSSSSSSSTSSSRGAPLIYTDVISSHNAIHSLFQDPLPTTSTRFPQTPEKSLDDLSAMECSFNDSTVSQGLHSRSPFSLSLMAMDG